MDDGVLSPLINKLMSANSMNEKQPLNVMEEREHVTNAVGKLMRTLLWAVFMSGCKS